MTYTNIGLVQNYDDVFWECLSDSGLNLYAAIFSRLFFIHLKLELLAQFPAPNDEK